MTETAQNQQEPQQRMRALVQANAVRHARAELKRSIAQGETSAADIILRCPEVAQRWTIAEVLVAQHRWGTTRCRKFLQRHGINEMKAIGDLTDRQAGVLATALATGVPARTRLEAQRVPAIDRLSAPEQIDRRPEELDPLPARVRVEATRTIQRARQETRELALV
jgi:hypothetical protein